MSSLLRKQPRQRRAEATIERIVDAGARVLVQYGYDGASTNRIAEAAGLSPGSVYQYFRDKDAIVLSVVARLSDDLTSRITAAVPLTTALSLEELARTVVISLVDALTAQADLLAAFLDRVPRQATGDLFGDLLNRAAQLTYLQLVANRDVVRHEDFEVTTWFVVQATSHLALRYVVDRPTIARERFVDELTTLLLGYAYRSSQCESR
ncbi:TetR/AcrR family transcriptional regulator [Mycobacterium sp. CVI_P3]|uniref:TetR/AcrR family transcriptional regulator n=1 Tax=Mycobacterium pinniadriaticum TaxID=2994102 RepID=A0ABT3SB17_9MYCO|nr:TetR/AcrR family transcriptional regulator [Mycobacterium pinniadriaticum]MCX2930246.1 TetR/AcrR family transcriptional regulator [Mycobacterium pinniadriaticum]MCX2936692.1 TetR/AcrR family transcriptional regulator [Mycobacterium pinniadriaticum]